MTFQTDQDQLTVSTLVCQTQQLNQSTNNIKKNEVINLSKTPKPDQLFSQVMGTEWGGFCLDLNDI